jgi:hypothetical protein
MGVTNTDLTVRIFVSDIAGVMASYDQLEVFRSTGDENGPWDEITAASATAATILNTKLEPYALDGKTLELRIGGVDTITAVFSGADPYTLAQAIIDINTALGPLGTAAEEGGYLRITAADTGTDSSVEVTGGTGYANIGLQLGQYDIGEDVRVPLVPGTQDYTELDHNGSRDYWYRVRYLNSGTGALSEYSVPCPGATFLVLPATDVIIGYVNLTDLSGNAWPNQRIIVSNAFLPSREFTYGVIGLDLNIYTDADGHAEVVLIKGVQVEVAFVGTGMRRRFVVPSSGSSFDLLDPSLADDEFGIQYNSVRIAERRFP